MTGKESVDKYCMSCSLGLYNCTLPVGKCPYIKAQEALKKRIGELEYSLEKALLEDGESEVAYKGGELTGWRDALKAIENLV